MESVLIKISKDGSSQEYLFHKLGPIIIGSDARCDLVLENPGLPERLMEVRVSGGRILITELSSSSQVFLDSALIPHREEIPYRQGRVISIGDTGHLVTIEMVQDETTPPPFHTEEFQQRIKTLGEAIKTKEKELLEVEAKHVSREKGLQNLLEKVDLASTKKSALVSKIDELQSKSNELEAELRKKSLLVREEADKLDLLGQHLGVARNENAGLNDSIIRQQQNLSAIKHDIESKQNELSQTKCAVDELKTTADRCKDQIEEYRYNKETFERELQHETEKIQKLLIETDVASRERKAIQNTIDGLLKHRESLHLEIDRCKDQLAKLEKSKEDVQSKKTELALNLATEEELLQKLKEATRALTTEQETIKSTNEDLYQELLKAEDRLSGRKNQYHQIEFQSQEAAKSLSKAQIETEQTINHLRALKSEEESSEARINQLKTSLRSYSKQVENDKIRLNKDFSAYREAKNLEINRLQAFILSLKDDAHQVENHIESLREKNNQLTRDYNSLQAEKSALESVISELSSTKTELLRSAELLREAQNSLGRDKSHLEKEITLLKSRKLETEALIKQREQEAYLDIENQKREARSLMIAEREVLLREVESEKQKAMLEVDRLQHLRQEELHQEKTQIQKTADRIFDEANQRAEVIIQRAKSIEADLVLTGTKRLQEATAEANKREESAHDKFHEAETVAFEAQAQAKELVRIAEEDFQQDLKARKIKLKSFLASKQSKNLSHFEKTKAAFSARMVRIEKAAQEKLEHAKRRELKKIARVRLEEVSHRHAMKEQILAEAKAERDNARRETMEMKRRQEAELAETKKSVLEHLSHTKAIQQKSLEDELTHEKHQFERTKAQRAMNATRAVINVLIAEVPGEQISDETREKIQSAIDMTINGHNPENQKKTEQILSFNPSQQKKVLSVLKKYALRGAPIAAALAFVADVGSIRTAFVNNSKNLLKSNHSASDTFVKIQKEEWKQKNVFIPETTVGYKNTYADNILYTTDFLAVMEDEAFQNDWILKLHDFMVKDLELSEDLAINYISAEGALLKEMELAKKDIHPQFKEKGIQKLRDLETTHLSWLSEKLSDPLQKQRFELFRKNHFDNFYQEKFLPNRSPASTKP